MARKDRSNSSASAMRTSPSPATAERFSPREVPPASKVGRLPAVTQMRPSMVVVVVLPWVPETASTYLPDMASPIISARRTTGMPRRRASASSGLSMGTAEE
jgi:hypothetical protein